MKEPPLIYSPREIAGYLPPGWRLAGTGQWSARARRWSARVIDGADQDWDLEVEARAAAKLGKSEALRAAMDRLYREALG